MSVATTTSIDWQALYRKSQDENEELRERLRQLTDLDARHMAIPTASIMRLRNAFGISAAMARLLLIFAENETVTRHLVSKSYPSLDAYGNSLPVMIAQLRALLRPRGLGIENIYRIGWQMNAKDRDLVQKLLA